MKIKLKTLQDLTHKALRNFGYAEDEIEIIKPVLLYAQMRGNNQGVVKLIGRGIPKPKDVGAIEIEKETKLSAVLNGHKNHAMIVVNKGTDIAIKKACEHGMGLVGINHINTSSGAIGYYARKIAQQNLIGFVFAGSMETVAPEGSSEKLFGTNPIAIGVPSRKEPLVLDMATAAMAFYGVVEANTAGHPLPSGIAYDGEGNPTTDPAKVLDEGALRTFDKGHKGSGLSMMVQLLTGPLVGASFAGFGDIDNNWAGHLIIAIDPELLNGADALREGVTKTIERMKTLKKLPGVKEVLVSGERGDDQTAAILASGELEIEDNLYHALEKAAG